MELFIPSDGTLGDFGSLMLSDDGVFTMIGVILDKELSNADAVAVLHGLLTGAEFSPEVTPTMSQFILDVLQNGAEAAYATVRAQLDNDA